jgi:poly(3-hydroxybutyrate) depolymerase
MQRGPQADVEVLGSEARAKWSGVLPVPLLAIHGDDDTVVAPTNSVALVRQYLRLNGHLAVAESSDAPAQLPLADSTIAERTADGRDVTTREWRIDGRLVVRHVAVAALGHAWSGGDDALAFNDARAPDASQLVGAFLREALP